MFFLTTPTAYTQAIKVLPNIRSLIVFFGLFSYGTPVPGTKLNFRKSFASAEIMIAASLVNNTVMH
jgi:hypothetical protein